MRSLWGVALVVELRKLCRLRSVRGIVVAVLVLVPALTALNGWTVRQSLGGQESPVTDASGVGQLEAMLAVAGVSALGVLAFWQEWRGVPPEAGGGVQAVSSRLASPRFRDRVVAKLLAVVGSSTALLLLAMVAAVVAARLSLGPFALPMDDSFWWQEARIVVYGVLTAVMAAGLSLLLRNGLLPMVWLVANSSVISVGYLLAQKWSWAWYLPDTAGSLLVRFEEEPGAPSMAVAALVATGWTLLAVVAGVLRERRRDL